METRNLPVPIRDNIVLAWGVDRCTKEADAAMEVVSEPVAMHWKYNQIIFGRKKDMQLNFRCCK